MNPMVSVIPVAIGFAFAEWRVYRWAHSNLDAATREWQRRAFEFSFSGESRDAACQRLESEVHASHGYALLRRITGLAPLCGVIFTAVLLATTNVASDDASGDSAGLAALIALRPVFWGVVLGAALSIVNQLLVVRFEATVRARIRDTVDKVPSDRFVGIREMLGTFPDELREVLAVLASSQQTVDEFQRRTTEQMGEILTRVSSAVRELADSASNSGEKLRESAASHFDQVKLTTKEFGKTIGQLALIVEKSNVHLGSVLSSATDQLGDAQRALAKAMQDIQVEASKAAGSLEKRTESLHRSTEEALAAVRRAVDDSLKAHNRALQDVLDARVREAAAAVEESRSLMRIGLDAAEQAVRRATNDLSSSASGLGGLASSISSLEFQIRESGSQTESGAAAAASLSRQLDALGVSVLASHKSLQSVTESVVAQHADWSRSVDASEQRLDAVASRLAEGIVAVQREVEALSVCTKLLAEQNSGLSQQLMANTAKLGELYGELKEPEKRRSWISFGGR